MTNPDKGPISLPPYILIAEDAKGITHCYKIILEKSNYDVTICHSGREVQSLIEKRQQFDLAIVDIVLPPENTVNLTLEDSQETGIRLIETMIKNKLCLRFYIITIRHDLRERAEQLCKGKAVLRFEYKLDHEPKNFLENIKNLLRQPVQSKGKNLLLELDEHIKKIYAYDPSINSLVEPDKALLIVSEDWIEKVLNSGSLQNVLNNSETKESWCKRLEHTLAILENRYSGYVAGTLNYVTDKLKIAISQFLTDCANQ